MHDAHQLDALLSASAGSKVGVFARTLTQVQAICNSMTDYVEDNEQAAVRRVNGQHEISFPNGGRIRFLSFSQSARGSVFDRVYVPLQTPSDTLMELIPSLATSDDGLLTGYL
jgi:hypothetical protein